MAPEQIDSTHQATGPAADVYALGAVLFEIVAGERFIAAPSVTDATIATLSGEVERRPSARVPGVVDAFDDICARALARDPLQRPRARAVHDAIDAFLAGESDRERQRALSNEHLAQARSNDDSVDGRARALRSLGSAIALDPGNVAARTELLRLLTTTPSTTPPEVAQAVAGDNLRRIRELARARRNTALLQVPFLLAGLLLEVQNALLYAAIVACFLSALVLTAWVALRPSTTARRLFAAHVAYLLGILATMTYAGPLLVAPSLLVGFIAQTQLDPRRRARRALLLLGIVVFLVGFLLERTGHLGATYAFVDGHLVISSGLAALDGAGLVVASFVAVATLLSTTLVVGRARDEIAGAERRLHLQAWQSSQLVSSTSRAP
jgi:hypothetical protein